MNHHSLLILFDKFSAFDMVDRHIILRLLYLEIPLVGLLILDYTVFQVVSKMIRPILDWRRLHSLGVHVNFGVRQGSRLTCLWSEQNGYGHLYANDVQAFPRGFPVQQRISSKSIWSLFSEAREAQFRTDLRSRKLTEPCTRVLQFSNPCALLQTYQ